MENKKEFDAFDEDDFFDEDETEDEDIADDGEEDTDTDAEEADENGEEGTDAEEAPAGEDFAARAEGDLAEITKAFPSLGLKSLGDIKNIQRFAELRDKGVSAAEAFAATNAQMLMEGAERVGASKATGKAHLQSVAKKAGARAASQMTNAEREAAREFFGDHVSDKELEQLFKKATKK